MTPMLYAGLLLPIPYDSTSQVYMQVTNGVVRIFLLVGVGTYAF